MPHEPDIKALLRVAALYNIPVACNETTADFLIESRFMHEPYSIRRSPVPEHIALTRKIPGATT